MKELSCCGTKCKECYCYGSVCKGCNETEGRVFFMPEGKACPIYECSIHKNRFEHCGNCEQLPCSIWRETRDPKFTDEEFEASIRNRMNALNKM